MKSVTAMLQNLWWQTLEQRRADALLCLFYKIVYGFVAVPLPVYTQQLIDYPCTATQITFTQIIPPKTLILLRKWLQVRARIPRLRF